jgi:acetyltransferase-like isoleucine patch superfamily enzyme
VARAVLAVNRHGVYATVRSAASRLARLRRRSRRAAWLLKLRASAVWERSRLDIDVADDVRLGTDVRVRLRPRATNGLVIAPHCVIGDRVTIELDGGRVQLGEHVELRRDVMLHVAGRFDCAGWNLLQWGASVHCDDAVSLGRGAVLSERATVVDSSHHHTTPEDWVLDNTTTKPVVIGANTWVGAKATISRGVTIGDHCIVAGNSLVVTDVPAGHLASGVPARVVRPLDLPWESRGLAAQD